MCPELHAPSRREYLAGVAAALSAGLAGCSTGDRTVANVGTDADPTAADSPTGTTATTPRDTPTTDPATPPADPTTTATPTRGTPLFAGYETTEVRVTTPGGDPLGSVTAAVADTAQLRYTGLSDTESLPPDRGMLFVFEEAGDYTFVMRGMAFGLDIVFADAEGVITRIHHAPAPGAGEGGEGTYPGRGKYVLEVNYGWTTDHGVTAGDVLRFDLG